MNHLRAQWRQAARKTARNIKGKDWYEHKENGKVVGEVFDPWWDSMHEQYALKGTPGITYFKGVISPKKWVDCLLYYDKDGDLVGIHCHYGFDFPPHEKKGNNLTVVAPGVQRKGIGTKLLQEALKRWPDMNLHQPENSNAGKALVRSLGR